MVGLEQEGLHEGGGNCLKYLKRWWNRKDGGVGGGGDKNIPFVFHLFTGYSKFTDKNISELCFDFVNFKFFLKGSSELKKA